MKKILLIRTSEAKTNSNRLSSDIVAPPLGLMYLASYVRESFPEKFDIRLIDMKISKLMPREMQHIISEYNPDIIGCSVLSYENDCMHALASISKKANKRIKFIIGGPHATMYHEEIMANEDIDVAVIGEGERTFCELLTRFENGNDDYSDVPGIVFRNRKGKICITDKRQPIQNLDSLPFPAWDLIKIEDYSRIDKVSMNTMIAGRKYMGIFTSRGCPYCCTYCHNIFGKTFRFRSPQNVFREMYELYVKYNVDEFHVYDDIFNFDATRAKRICDFIIDAGIKIKLAFPNGIRGDIIDEELISKLKRAGAYSLTFALETASERLQRKICKNINIRRLTEVIDIVDKYRILGKCYFMLGFPSETREEVKKTIDFACRSRLNLASFFIVTPQKNTALFEELKNDYPEFNVEFDRYHYYISNTVYKNNVVRLPLDRLQKLAYFRFYSNPLRLFKLWNRTPRKVFLLRSFPLFLKRLLF